MQQYPQAPATQAQSLSTPMNPSGVNNQPLIPQSSYSLPPNMSNQQNTFVSQPSPSLPQNNPPNTTYPPVWSNNIIGQSQNISQFQNSSVVSMGQPGSIPNQPPNPNMASSSFQFGGPISNQQLFNPSVPGPFQPMSQLPGPESSQVRDQSPKKLIMEPEVEPVTIKDAVTYLSSNIFQERIQGMDCSYFLAQKQNATGIKYNTRFFVVDSDDLGYSTQFNPKELQIPFKSLSKFPAIKKRYKLQNITLEDPKKESMKIQIQNNSKDKIIWLLRAVDKDANTMLQIHTLLLEAKNNKELRTIADKQPLQNLDNFKPIIRSPSQNNSNQPVNPYQSPNSSPQTQQQQIQPSNIHPTSTLQGGLIRADSLQNAQTGTQSQLNNFNPNQILPNQQNQFGQQNQLNQFGQLNQINPTNQSVQFGQFGQSNQPVQSNQFGQSQFVQPDQIGQFNQSSLTMGNNIGQTGFTPQNIQYVGQQSSFLQSGQQLPFQQSNSQQYSNVNFDKPLTETDILKETFNRLASQTRSNQRDNLPVMNSVVQQSAVYQDFRRNFINEVEERKKLLYGDNQNWNYQFLKGDEENVLVNFKIFAEALVADIIDDMNEGQSNYRPSDDLSETESIITYKDYQGVEVRLCLTAIKEYKLLKQTKQSVYDEFAIKAAFREFNNMDYLMQFTRNKGKIRLPLVAIVEYKGIVAFVKSSIPVDNNKVPTSLLKELELLSRQTRIKDSIFDDGKAIVIAPLQSKFYEKLAREENNAILRQPNAFDIYYLDKVKHFLPADLQFASKDPENYILRQEFIQREEFSDMNFLGENMKKYLGKQKIPKEIQQSIRQLDESERVIVKIVNELVEYLEETNESIVSSQDWTRLLHKHGLNIRYLGLIYSTTKAPFILKACMAEIAARSAKSVLQYDLQSIVKNAMMSKKNSQTDACSITDTMLDFAIDFLNSVTGNTQDSGEIWTRINKQALYEYNVPLVKQDVAEGHFIQALLHHCNFRCRYRYDQGDNLFIRNIFERTRDTVFTVKSRVYSLKFTDLYKSVHDILTSQAEDSFDQLKSLLNLRKADIPQHMRLDNTYDELAVYLSGIVPPKYKEMMQDNLPCSSLYQMAKHQMPSLASFQIALAQIKWDLKNDKVEDALSKKDYLEKKIIRWCSDIHPVLTDLYNIFTVYYLNRCKFEEAMKYAKSSLANNSNLLGNNSLKTAESHYELANVFLKASKRQEALIYFRKAKSIFDNKNARQRLSYAQIEIKIAALDLQFDKFEEAEAFALHAITIFEMVDGHQTELVQAYELISRVYEVTNRRDQMAKTAEYCGRLLSDISEQSNLEKMIKIAILPVLNDIPTALVDKFILLIQNIPYLSNTSNPVNALNYLKGFIQKGIFMDKFMDYINNLEDIILVINKNGLLDRWRGFQTQTKTGEQEFIAIMESLVYLLGQGFIQGALNHS